MQIPIVKVKPWVMVLIVTVISPMAMADIYGFTDAEGTLVLSDRRQDNRYALLLKSEVDNKVVPATPMAGGRINWANIQRYASLVAEAAQANQLEEALLHAVISTESGYQAHAVSPKGAVGLMQVMPATGRRYGAQDLRDPAENIRAGAKYLRDLIRRFDNDLALALAAYNAGENAVERYGRKIPPYRETVQYVPRVLALYKKFQSPG